MFSMCSRVPHAHLQKYAARRTSYNPDSGSLFQEQLLEVVEDTYFSLSANHKSMLLWKQIRSLARSARHMLITNASAATLRLASFEELKINHDSKVGEPVYIGHKK